MVVRLEVRNSSGHFSTVRGALVLVIALYAGLHPAPVVTFHLQLFSCSSSRLRLHLPHPLHETFFDYSEFLVCLLTVRSELYGTFSLSTQLDYKPLEGSFVCHISLCSVQCTQICVAWMARGPLQAQSCTGHCDRGSTLHDFVWEKRTDGWLGGQALWCYISESLSVNEGPTHLCNIHDLKWL